MKPLALSLLVAAVSVNSVFAQEKGRTPPGPSPTASPTSSPSPSPSPSPTASPNAAVDRETQPLDYINVSAALNLVHHINRHEIQQAESARNQLKNEEATAFAERLIAEHGESEATLRELARQEEVVLYGFRRSTFEFATDARLRRIPDESFDLGFMAVQALSHQRSLENLQLLQAEVQDPEVKAFLNTTIQSVRAHLDEANRVRTAVEEAGNGNEVTPSPTPSPTASPSPTGSPSPSPTGSPSPAASPSPAVSL